MMATWMIDAQDPARLEIVKRAQALGITGNPDKAAHPLGPITLAEGRTVNAHVVHAVDPIISDGVEIVMINRKHDPGMGKPALPAGFLIPTEGASKPQFRPRSAKRWKRSGLSWVMVNCWGAGTSIDRLM